MNPVRSRFRHLHVVHGLSNPLTKLSSMLTVALCGIACSLLRHALHRITVGGKSACFTLNKKQFLDFSEGNGFGSEPHWFPVWSFPLEHIHLSGCRVAQFQPASTGLLHSLASGILSRLCMHCLALGSISGHEMISPRLVLRTQPQNSIMPMQLFLWYLRLLPISNWTTFLVDCCGWPPSSLYCVCAPCSLACDQE